MHSQFISAGWLRSCRTATVLSAVALSSAASQTARTDDGPPLIAGQAPTPVTEATVRRIRARRVSTAPALDGRLDEIDWQLAPVTGLWRGVIPDQGVVARAPSTARVLWDDNALYVGFDARHPAGTQPRLRSRNLQRDFLYPEHDNLAVLFDPFRDRRTMYMLGVGAGGNQDDRTYTMGVGVDIDWDTRWQVRVARSDSGWSAEMRIPWSALPYPAGDSVWGINFYRGERSLNEMSLWAPVPRGTLVFRGDFAGRLEGISPPARARDLQAVPYVLGQWRDMPRGTSPSARNVPAYEPQVGGEVRWRPTRSLVVDATFNTDFAQADVDRQVVNLTRFSVFLPERRPFFQEGRLLFTSGIDDRLQPFFTRRIGLDDAGRTVPIRAGARIMERSANGQSGFLVVRQGASETGEESLIGVLRSTRNLGTRYRVGYTAAARVDDVVPDSNANPVPGTRRREHVTAGVDAFAQLTAAISMDAGLSMTRTDRFLHERALPGDISDETMREPFLDSTRIEGKEALAGHVRWQHQGPRFGSVASAEFAQADYDPRVGFLGRRDYVRGAWGGEWDIRPQWKPSWLLRIVPGYEGAFVTSASRRTLEERRGRLWPIVLERRDGSRFQVGVEQERQVLVRDFAAVPGMRVTPGQYDALRTLLTLSRDPSRRVTGRTEWSIGEYFDGRLLSSTNTAQISFDPRIATTMRYTMARFDNVGGVTRTTHLFAPELRLAWNPRLQLAVFHQYNTAAGVRSTNVRASWEMAPLSFLHVVWNSRSPTPGTELANGSGGEMIVKFTYRVGR